MTKDTMNFYEKTLNFKLTSNNLEQEVSRKRFNILQLIDETYTVTREMRGLVNLVGRMTLTRNYTIDKFKNYNLVNKIVLKATANTFKDANQMEAQINRLIEWQIH
ncbi:Uncharacterized protein FWK35_00025583 [Aphis craccivora]|uniref:Uncharacterized protein n=1 Tax=Aphis craccivora TaxID=307492 RepID=A0A6G0W0F5_APHCR|nr:Uncharacterized protein FWK35_00025583 [Aphis craccivora]